MIVPAKQLLIILPSEGKEFFLYDPKTACVLYKFAADCALAPTAAYYSHSRQFLIPHANNTYVNIWETDVHEPRKYSLAEGEQITTMFVYESLLLMGTINGKLLIYQLPSGILIRRVPIHSGSIIKVSVLSGGYVISCSCNQIKLFAWRDLLAEGVRPIALKTIHSVPTIINYSIVRNILCIICQNSLNTYYADSFAQCDHELYQISNATCSCASPSHLYIGQNTGKIKKINLGKNLLDFDEKKYAIKTIRKQKMEILDNKEAVAKLTFVESLQLLISGNCKGEIKIWNDKNNVQNCMNLFKCCISNIIVIDRPDNNEKIPQNKKITALQKQEMSKLQSPIFIKGESTIQEDIQPNNHQILSAMFEHLNDPIESLVKQMKQIKVENEKLINANLYYSTIFDAQC